MRKLREKKDRKEGREEENLGTNFYSFNYEDPQMFTAMVQCKVSGGWSVIIFCPLADVVNTVYNTIHM